MKKVPVAAYVTFTAITGSGSSADYFEEYAPKA
jgi:hypothetical protein